MNIGAIFAGCPAVMEKRLTYTLVQASSAVGSNCSHLLFQKPKQAYEFALQTALEWRVKKQARQMHVRVAPIKQLVLLPPRPLIQT